MAKLSYTDPSTGEERTIEADIPVGMENNQNFLTKTIKEHLARNPEVEKSRRASMQGLQGPADLTKPVSYTPASKLPTNPTGLRKALIGPQGGQPADVPVISPFIDIANRGLRAPISGGSWQDKTADVIEGAGSILGAGFAPQMASAPVKALTSIIPGIIAQQGVEKVTGNRLAGDVAGLAAGGIEAGSPKVRAVTRGAVEGAAKAAVMPDATYHGIPVPPSIAGGALGAIAGRAVPAIGAETGAITGATLPVARGAYLGGKEAARGVPWFEPSKVSSHDIPIEHAPSVGEQMSSPPYKSTQLALPPGPNRVFNMGDPQTIHYPSGTAPEPSIPVTYGPKELPPGVGDRSGEAIPLAPAERTGGRFPSKEVRETRRTFYSPEEQKPTETPGTSQEDVKKLIGRIDEKSSQKTEEAKPASSTPEEHGSATTAAEEEITAALPNGKDINPVMDKVLAIAKPEWNGEQIDYPHIVKVADSIGIKPNQIRTMLKELGYDVVPSKFPERVNKGTYKDIPWDKLMKALSDLGKD